MENRKAELRVGKTYTAGAYQFKGDVVDVEVIIPDYASFKQTIPMSEATPEKLEAFRVQGEAELIRVVEKYSVTIHQPDVEVAEKKTAAG